MPARQGVLTLFVLLAPKVQRVPLKFIFPRFLKNESFSSPEEHLHFQENASVAEVVGTILFWQKILTSSQYESVLSVRYFLNCRRIYGTSKYKKSLEEVFVFQKKKIHFREHATAMWFLYLFT